MPRFHCPAPLATGAELDLPPGAARHVQVLRLQPGDGITLFHGGQGYIRPYAKPTTGSVPSIWSSILSSGPSWR